MRIELSKITPLQKLKIQKGLCDYEYIMTYWKNNDADFKEVYYGFYLKAGWAVMSNSKNANPYFAKLQKVNPDDELIDVLHDLMNNMENKKHIFSFATKLLHTRNPLSPIYDSKIRNYLSEEENVNFWWQIPNKKSRAPRGTNEEEKITHDWNLLCDWYKSFLGSERGKQWISWFNDNFPEYSDISNVKKIDFIIFATN